MSGAGTIIFVAAVVGFFGACWAVVRKGTSPDVRFRLCVLQTACAAGALLIAIPQEPTTDVGRLANKLGNRYQERFAARLEERLNAIHVDAR